MQNPMYNVLIVEDDFRVAEITKGFVEKVDGFNVIGLCKTGAETESFLFNLNETTPDLILLDVYIPDVNGLDLFWKIRENLHQVDIVMITAAKEVYTIEEALRGGIFDYIVKPVDFNRFKRTLDTFKDQRGSLSSKEKLNQEEIDLLTRAQSPSQSAALVEQEQLPKGIDSITLDKVKNILSLHSDTGITASSLGEAVGISRSTARRYLEYLVSISEARAELSYGDVGRPERLYISNK
ncbi:two-component response regulator [Alkalihalophilus pseudofirmus OF4]|uniref:Two-component response regulator n=1 Tax=Alkalihalophilus pseudofirmus (strain ATCC BAA-2126 / JCM 17055 / OF4) TaxID=398511 RepID=D3FSG7_ALKPO|nr:response regulator [Alkalihalophilus pseudofirmus]ADC49935.1 two-component response regulator [Alkalihalophilus pseudofirmus OF4]